MKYNHSFLIKVALLMIVIGVFLFSIGFYKTSGDINVTFGAGGIKQRHIETISVEPFDKVEVDVNKADVKIVAGDGYRVDYALMDPLDVDIIDGTLLIKSHKHNVGVGIQLKPEQITITVPDKLLNGIEIHSSLGNVETNNVQVLDLKLASGGGKILVKDSSFETLNINNSLGDIIVEEHKDELLKTKSIDITQKSGNVYMDVLESDSLTIIASLGNIDLNAENIRDLSLETQSGDINSSVDSGRLISMKAVLGNINLNTKNQDYTIDATTNLGDINYNGKGYGTNFHESKGQDVISVITNTGTISITIEGEEDYE